MSKEDFFFKSGNKYYVPVRNSDVAYQENSTFLCVSIFSFLTQMFGYFDQSSDFSQTDQAFSTSFNFTNHKKLLNKCVTTECPGLAEISRSLMD